MGAEVWRAAETLEEMGRLFGVEQRKVTEILGVDAGYRYVASPLIWPASRQGPDGNNNLRYVPTARPGTRLPHVWLEDGTALHDRLGPGYTLLRLGSTRADTNALEQGFRRLVRSWTSSTFQTPPPGIFTNATWSSFAQTCTWYGVATGCPRALASWQRQRPATSALLGRPAGDPWEGGRLHPPEEEEEEARRCRLRTWRRRVHSGALRPTVELACSVFVL